MKEYQKAVQSYQKAIEENSRYVLAYQRLGNLMEKIDREGNCDKIAELYGKIIDINP